MVWLLIAASIYAIIFVAGRAHSRYLDRLEARPRVVMTVQLFNVSPDLVKETEFTVDLTSEAIRNVPIESLDSFSVRNGSQTCVSAPTADNRTFNHGIRLVPDEAELIAFNKQNPPGVKPGGAVSFTRSGPVAAE
jgi:hypothetical protein